VATFPYGDRITRVAFSPDGQYVAAGGGSWTESDPKPNDTRVLIWRVRDGNLVQVLESNLVRGAIVKSIVWSPNGRTLAWAREDGTLHFWQAP
jgi:hypothetical protein